MKFKNLAFLLFAAFTFSFLSCKKDSKPEYYFKFKMNGNWVTWTKTVGELGPDLMDDSKTNLGIMGQNENSNEMFDISLQVDGSQITTGTYESDDYFMPFLYVVSSPELKSYTQGYVDGREDSKYTITITSITEKSISGRFTGNYLENDFADDDVLNITEGEFVVERIR